jgi:hypothetical protein
MEEKVVSGVYDILQKDAQGVLWIGTEPSMDKVLIRVREHSRGSGEYIVLHQTTGKTTTIRADQLDKLKNGN